MRVKVAVDEVKGSTMFFYHMIVSNDGVGDFRGLEEKGERAKYDEDNKENIIPHVGSFFLLWGFMGNTSLGR